MADLRVDHADWLLTVDRDRRILRDGAVAVADGRIVAVGKTAEVAPQHPAPRVISARGKVVTPGLVDRHIHTAFPDEARGAGGSEVAGELTPAGRKETDVAYTEKITC